MAGLYSPTEGTVSYGETQIPAGKTASCGEAQIPVGKTGSCGETQIPAGENVSCGEAQRGGGRIGSGISAVFQKFCRYNLSLGDNIRISDMDGDRSEEKLNRICRDIGVVPEWAGGMDGMLGREFGGAEVSGGQWQRIAIARGMYRNNSLLILDEPTAAIDALEEKYLYEEFGRLSRSCTSVIVTHRLASAQIADRILVVKDGRIVQDGSHSELLAVEGEYKTMYELQRQWYQ
ncbi:MAG: ABC transporter ATP-binding protein/permease [bacterium]|nr:ABC transporter ATP-binding protein/permease [bacterium]